jgi:hypothetical protein
MPDHDLWEVLHSLLVNAPVQIQIFQVASHQVNPDADDFLRWVFEGNQPADFAALWAMSQLPGSVLQLQQQFFI